MGTHTPIPDASNDDDDFLHGPPSPELPLTMTASAILTSLPVNATAALQTAVAQLPPAPGAKVVVRFKPVGGSPPLQRSVCKVSADQKFEFVVRYLRKQLKCADTDSAFLYVNSAFAPSLDEVVGNLHQVCSPSSFRSICYADTD